MTHRLRVLGRLLVALRAETHFDEQPEYLDNERPCFHAAVPNVPFDISAAARTFHEGFWATLVTL
jgi:hypothetical protein